MKELDLENLKGYIEIFKEIKRIEDTLLNNEFIDGWSKLYLENLRENVWNLYSQYEDKNRILESTTLVDVFFNIKNDNNTYFDFGKLSDLEIKENTKKIKMNDFVDGKPKQKIFDSISILKSDYNKYPHAIINFKDDDEIINFIYDTFKYF